MISICFFIAIIVLSYGNWKLSFHLSNSNGFLYHHTAFIAPCYGVKWQYHCCATFKPVDSFFFESASSSLFPYHLLLFSTCSHCSFSLFPVTALRLSFFSFTHPYHCDEMLISSEHKRVRVCVCLYVRLEDIHSSFECVKSCQSVERNGLLETRGIRQSGEAKEAKKRIPKSVE